MPKQDISADYSESRLPIIVSRSEPGPVRSALLSIADAQKITASWQALCRDLVEENPFFNPWALLPALSAYGDARVRLACVWAGDLLIGLLPVTPLRGYAKLPVGYWATWLYPHCYFGAPLVRNGFVREFFTALFSLLCDDNSARAFLRLKLLDRDGALAAGVEAVIAGRRVYHAGAFRRALLCAGPHPDVFLKSTVGKKKRKELKRLRRRLDEQGVINVQTLTDADRLEDWVRDFLTLENKGWKGRLGTALKANARDAQWFRDTLFGAHAAGKLHFVRLNIDDAPLAMLASLLSNGAGYSLKICHDPAFDRFSPGVMAEIEASKLLLAQAGFQFMDSCAAPDHPMINRLWRDRRTLTGINISGDSAASKTTLAICGRLELLRRQFPAKAAARLKGEAL